MKKVAQVYRGGKLITPPYKFYKEYNPDGTVTPHNLELVTDGTSLFYGKKITVSKMALLNCAYATSLLNTANSVDGEMDVDLPICVYAVYLCIYSLFERIKVFAPLLTQTEGWVLSCPNLHTLIVDLPRLKLADGFAQNATKLATVSTNFPSLSSGKNMFLNCKLSDVAINAILESLPTYTSGTHIITFTGCPGAATCDPTIGSTKGWTVEL